MVTQPSPSAVALVEPAAPMWAQRMALKMVGFFMPITPRAPMPLWTVTKANLPPAADWPNTVVIVSDQSELAISLGGAWLKISTGGPV
jgi:hypothetical protein